jgi:EH_Signature domain
VALTATLRNLVRSSKPAPRQLSSVPKMERAAARIAELVSAAPKPLSDDYLADLRSRLSLASASRNWDLISVRDWREVPWVLWDASPYIAEREGVIEHYLAFLQRIKSAAPWRRLIYAYLLHFAPDLHGFESVSAALRGTLSSNRHPGLREWFEHDRATSLFSPKVAPQSIARALIESRRPADAEHGMGLRGQFATGRLASAVHKHLLALTEKAFVRNDYDQSFVEAVLGVIGNADGLRFPDLRVDVAHALLRPWVNQKNLEGAVQSALRDFLLRNLGDPMTSRPKWHGVEPESMDVMRRWLAHERLEYFFRIIDRTSKQSDSARRHWPYRKAFWLAYWRKGALDDAWLGFGPKALDIAKEALPTRIGYGRLLGAEAHQSILIMRISNLVFLEWSHTGRCRAWVEGRPGAPEIGRSQYHKPELFSDSLEMVPGGGSGIVHASSETWSWQGKLAQFVQRRTGVAVTQQESMFRG